MTAYAPDTYLTPIVLTPGTDNVIVITEDPGGGSEVVRTITLIQNSDTASTTPETWFLHDDESFHATKPGLLYAIRKLLTSGTTVGCGTASAAATNTYTWACVDPGTSSGLSNNGCQLRADSATHSFEVSWTHASSTISAHYFGSILFSPLSDDASSTSGSDEVLTWPNATHHRMVTRDLSGEDYAIDKRRHNFKDSHRSSSRPSDSVSVVWDEGFVRHFVYQDVYASEVHETRANESEWASAFVTRATNDIGAVWFAVWDALTDDLEVLVVHNSSDDFQVDTHSYETVKLWSDLDWDDFANQTSPGGDLYDISFTVWVDETASSYDH